MASLLANIHFWKTNYSTKVFTDCSKKFGIYSKCDWKVGFPGGSVGKESACQCRSCLSSNSFIFVPFPGSGRSPGEGNGYALLFSCLENPMDRGAWWVTVHTVAKRQTQLKQLSTQLRQTSRVTESRRRVGGVVSVKVKVLVAQSCLTLLWPRGL